MVLAVVTEIPLRLDAVEHDPFIDPPTGDDVGRRAMQPGAVPPAVDVRARQAAADTGAIGTDERVLTRAL